MPIECRVKFPRLSEDEMRAVDYRVISMESNGKSLGNQRFHLVSETTPFRLTTFPDAEPDNFVKHLLKLLKPSPFELFYWVNIGRHRLAFQTVRQEHS